MWLAHTHPNPWIKEDHMMKQFGKGLLVGAGALGTAAAVGAVVVNTTQARSFRSWLIEQVMWASGLKRKHKAKGNQGMAYREAQQQPDTAPLPHNDVNMPVDETTVDGMQVFTWNGNGKANQPVLFYIHGGAYVSHAVNLNYYLLNRITKRTGAKVVMPIYPLAPKHTYDTVYPKVLKAYQQTVEAAGHPSRVSIVGDSAGGGFALGLGQVLKAEGLPQPKQYIVFSPWVDLRMTNDLVDHYEAVDPVLERTYLRVAGQAWAGSVEATYEPRVSPVLGDFTNMAPVTVFMGTHELLMGDLPALEDALKAGFVDYRIIIGERMMHVWPCLPIPEAEKAADQVAALINY